MNITILPTAYPNIYNDHSSIFVQDQAKALAKLDNLNINVIGAIPISFRDIWKKKRFRFGFFKYIKDDVNVELFLFPSIPKLKRFNNFIRLVINKILIKQLYKSIDIIHAHNATAGETALWCKNKFDIPYCITEHSSIYARGLLKEYEIDKYRKIYKQSSYNIAVSQEFSLLLTKLFNIDFYYISNIVDTNFFIPIEKQKNKKVFKFINIANLNKNKNQSLLIKSFVNSFKNNSNVSLSILGSGLEYHSLKKEIEELNMQNQIILYGFATRDEVIKELQSSDAFVLSSEYETFGVVLIEAMSCGLPVISTKCGGPESIILDDGLGLLVDKNNITELSNGMLKVYKNNYDSAYIRTYCVNNFSENIVIGKLIKVYEEIINENQNNPPNISTPKI